MHRLAGFLVVVLALAGCAGGAGDDDGSPAAASSSRPAAAPSAGSPGTEPVAATATLACDHVIGGNPPPPDYTVVLDAVALPAAPQHPALQAGPNGGGSSTPALFAKTGLLVRAGAEFVLETPPEPGNRTAIGWSSWDAAPPTRLVVVPGCLDAAGTGWLAYAGGYWADEPLCLPVIVRAGGEEQQVHIGIGTACPGQPPVPAP